MISVGVELLREANKHPFYGLFLGATLGVWMHFSLQYFAPRTIHVEQAGEIKALYGEVKALSAAIEATNAQMKRDAIRARIETMENEIFTLERVIADTTTPPRRIDQLRLNRLRYELSELRRELERLNQ